ncbi:hypothetical protein PV326_002599 [Microctonus aethiopoides]|nr:hypothetical protein PV326_002599 [Microctonus aethiopoides]
MKRPKNKILDSVHEDRTEEDHQRRQSQCSPSDGEVAGLEQNNDNTTVTTLPGGGGGPGGRPIRTRPLSLAVQPLHYHRVDPDIPTIITTAATSVKSCVTHDQDDQDDSNNKHPNMTSQDSIGTGEITKEYLVLSDDDNYDDNDDDDDDDDNKNIFKQHYHSSETGFKQTIGSVSEKTLHSLNLSSNGDLTTEIENPLNGNNSSEVIQSQSLKAPNVETSIDNLNGDNESEQVTAKKPSYLGLACSISGYSGITRYDSKLREGFRSRDSSPGSRLITRETSPAGFRSNEHLGVPTHSYPIKSQSISPLAMERQNGFSNGNKECKVETFVESRSSLNISQGYSEVDRGVALHSTFADISPIRSSNTSGKKSFGVASLNSYNKETKSFSSNVYVSSPRTSNNHHDNSFLNGSSVEHDNQTINISNTSEKSFIQQRVERLYGPGALANTFFTKRASTNSILSESSFNKSSNSNDISTDHANTEESLKKLPVLRHLRPEFRAQLPVVSPRRPTDGSEQIVKPLQRISVSPRKNEVTVKVPVITTQNVIKVHDTFNESLKLSASMTSITDQQPAAPEVVLPVLEPSASSTNLAEQLKVTQESDNADVEKDGHYFIRLLKAEIERLFLLAASAEVELESNNSLPEEAAGKLRSAAGKARLLATQKMQQFEGLCQKNINQMPGEEFPTTNEDLAGFWDMVMLQVVQVNNLFEHINRLKNSQWQEVRSVATVPVKKPQPETQYSSKIKKPLINPKCRAIPRAISIIHYKELTPKYRKTTKKKSIIDSPLSNEIPNNDKTLNTNLSMDPVLNKKKIFEGKASVKNGQKNNPISKSIKKETVKSSIKNSMPVKSIGGFVTKLNPSRMNYVKIIKPEMKKVITQLFKYTGIGNFSNAPKQNIANINQEKLRKNTSIKMNSVENKEPNALSPIQVKTVPYEIINDENASGDYEHPLVWSQSDSKPFIPLSEEFVDSLDDNHESTPDPQSTILITKLERMKKYDENRKKILQKRKQKNSPILNHLHNDVVVEMPLRNKSVTARRSKINGKEIRHDFAVEYLLSPRPLGHSYFSKIANDNFLFEYEHIHKLNPTGKGFNYLISDFMKSFSRKMPQQYFNSKRAKDKTIFTSSFGNIVKMTLKPFAGYSKYFRADKKTSRVHTDDEYSLNQSQSLIISERMKDTCALSKFNKIFCRLSFYLYVYGVIPEKTVTATAQNGNNTKRRVVVTQKPKPTANSEANRKAREAREQARRQMLEDRRKAMKSKTQQSVEIFAPKT